MSARSTAAGRPVTPSSGYWYSADTTAPDPVDVLNLLRRYREAEHAMRVRTRDSMRMGETDLVALRHLLKASRSGEITRQRDLAKALGITAASASSLVDRLVRDGYVRRVPHPMDRRSVAIETTAKTDEEVRSTLGGGCTAACSPRWRTSPPSSSKPCPSSSPRSSRASRSMRRTCTETRPSPGAPVQTPERFQRRNAATTHHSPTAMTAPQIA